MDHRTAKIFVESVGDLITDPKFKPYFYKRLYKMGAQQFLDAADYVRKHGVDKARYFALLIK